MFNQYKKQVNIIIYDRVIRYAVSTNSSNPKITSFGEKIIDADIIEDGKILKPAALQSVLTKLVREKKWKRKKLAFIVHDSSITVREQVVPKGLSKPEIKSYIMIELEDNIRLPFTNPVIDFEIIIEDEEQTKILLFAYPKDRLQPFIDSFEKVGLKPYVADFSAISIFRVYKELQMQQDQEHLLMVQWRIDGLVLTAFYQDKPIFTRYIKSRLNESEWTWTAQTNTLNWTGDEEDLNQDMEEHFTAIERFLDFYRYSVRNGDEQITKILFLTDSEQLKSMDHNLNGRFNIPVEMMDQLEEMKKIPAKYADVVGLSLKK